MIHIIYSLVALFASLSGASCGMGGGVIIKPVLDSLGLADVAAISFLSSCTVLSMSTSSIIKTQVSKSSEITAIEALPIASGAMIGGIAGKNIFQSIQSLFLSLDFVGAIQSLCLMILTIGCLFYSLNQNRINNLHFKRKAAQLIIGLCLGIVSSFLGIGGGPINLVVLYFFFSMDTKKAAQCSMYIIFFSQTASIICTFILGSVPPVSTTSLILMCLGGILGGTLGTTINRRIHSEHVRRIFLCLMLIIICINLHNFINFIA